MAENIEVRWSNEAKADLKRIFEIILDHTSSELSARNVIKDILQKTKTWLLLNNTRLMNIWVRPIEG